VPIVLELCKKSILHDIAFTIMHVSEEYIHILSHRRLLAVFIRIEVNGIPELSGDLMAVKKNAIAELPLPRLIDRYLTTIL